MNITPRIRFLTCYPFIGIKVDSSWTYKASFYYKVPTKSNFRGTLTVGLQSSAGRLLASKRVSISGSTTSWTHVQLSLRPLLSAKDTKNSFVVTVDGAAGQTINFAMFSLFPPTYKNRPNGMRKDLAEVHSALCTCSDTMLMCYADFG